MIGALHPDLERAIADFEARIQARARAGYGAFPDFDTAYLWYKLFGRPSPPPLEDEDPKPAEQGNEPQPADESDNSDEPDFDDPDDLGPDEGDIDDEGFEPSDFESDIEDSDRTDEDGGVDETEGEDSESEDAGADESPSFADLLERLGRYKPPPERERPKLSGWDRWDFSRDRTPERLHRHFDSWPDFVQCVTDDSLFAFKNVRHSHDPERTLLERCGGSGVRNFDEAVRMATQTGWPEGRKLMREALALVHLRPEIYESTSFDVAGAFPIIPLFCAGDPACMTDFENQTRQPNPLVRIDCDISANWMVTAEEKMLHGAAILSLADQLENSGRSVEIRLVGSTTSWTSDFEYSFSIVFKRAGEPWDLDRSAFAIAHPATHRRLAFALLEQNAELYAGWRGSYGIPKHEPLPETHPNTIFIRGAKPGTTADSARALVAEAAQTFLEQGLER